MRLNDRMIDSITILGVVLIILTTSILAIYNTSNNDGKYNDGEKLKIVLFEKEHDAIVLNGNKNNKNKKVTICVPSKDSISAFEVREEVLDAMIKKAP